MHRYGVIDLGTNTFHLLIAEKEQGAFKELYRKRGVVKLAEEGIQTIGEAPYRRAMANIRAYKKILDEFQVCEVKAIGTAALRTSSNGKTFIEQVKAETGIEVELITGSREAILIYKGVRQAVPIHSKKDFLIMDIGGGSVEFIIANMEGVIWAESFPIGVAVLYKNFHQQNPITANEVQEMYQFFDLQLAPLFHAIKKHPLKHLIGSAGTFDVIEANVAKEKQHPLYGFIPLKSFDAYYKKILPTTYEERLQMEQVPNPRADMIVVALILIDYIVNKIGIENITVSTYAMKEGMLYEMMQEG